MEQMLEKIKLPSVPLLPTNSSFINKRSLACAGGLLSLSLRALARQSHLFNLKSSITFLTVQSFLCCTYFYSYV